MGRAIQLMSAGTFAVVAGLALTLTKADSSGALFFRTAPVAMQPSESWAQGFETNDNSLEQTTQHIIAHLNLNFEAEILSLSADTEGAEVTRSYAIADVGTLAPKPDDPLAELVARAMLRGHDQARIHYDLTTAALAGELTVPAVLITADGRIDTALLLDRTLAQAAMILAQ